jgi:hypothetical protein
MSKQPPTTMSLVWCPECGHTNRFADLRLNQQRHYSGGKVCPGKPEHLAYVLDPTTTGAAITTGMVEAGARALAQEYLRTFNADDIPLDRFWQRTLDEDRREGFRREARLVLEAMATLAAGDAA